MSQVSSGRYAQENTVPIGYVTDFPHSRSVPISDWTDQTGGPASYTDVSETALDDSTWILSPPVVTDAAITFGLLAMPDPGVGNALTLIARAGPPIGDTTSGLLRVDLLDASEVQVGTHTLAVATSALGWLHFNFTVAETDAFRTGAGFTTYSFFDDGAPPGAGTFANTTETNASLRFYLDSAAQVTEIRYYRSPTDTGPTSRVLGLYRDSDSVLLWSGGTTSEVSGWNSVPVGVLLAADTTYSAVWHAGLGTTRPQVTSVLAGLSSGILHTSAYPQCKWLDSPSLALPTNDGDGDWTGLDVVVGIGGQLRLSAIHS